MHNYSKSKELPLVVYYYSAIIAVIIYLKFFTYINSILPTWAEGISPIVIMSFFIWLINTHLWKWRFIQWIMFLNIPNINGEWNGYINSSYDKFKKNIPAKIHITQTLSQIRIKLETATSKSESRSLQIEGDCSEAEIIYTFINTPEAGKTTMSMHGGTAELNYSINKTKKTLRLKGQFYTNPSRKTYGNMDFTKKY